jgi:hypothetical protein
MMSRDTYPSPKQKAEVPGREHELRIWDGSARTGLWRGNRVGNIYTICHTLHHVCSSKLERPHIVIRLAQL